MFTWKETNSIYYLLWRHIIFLEMYRYPVKYLYPVVSGKMLPDNILVFDIGETGVKTLERELKSCVTGLTSAPSFVDYQTRSSFI